MKRLCLVVALALASGAHANERAESEARLAALAEVIIPALGAAMPTVPGMTCAPADPDPSSANRRIVPNWRATCIWAEGGKEQRSDVVLFFWQAGADLMRTAIAETADSLADGSAPPGTQVFGAPEPRAALRPHDLRAAPGRLVAALASVPRGPDDTLPPAGIVPLALALAEMDVTAVEALPEVAQHGAALADHRRLLETQRESLRAVLGAATGTEPGPPILPGLNYPDTAFFGVEPLVQTTVTEAGVTMTATLTTSPFALEAAAEDGQFTGQHRNGQSAKGGVFNDRGRVQLYLRENQMTALIDGRGMLMLYVAEEVAGTDQVAAMEAVLARIAATDFSGY